MFETGYFLTIPQIIGAVKRRWFPASLLVLMIIGVSAVVLFMVRDLYRSDGKFYLMAGRATMSVDPTATTGQTSALLDTRQAEIQSIKEMLSARALMERVVEQIGADRILDQRSWIDDMASKAGDLKANLLGKRPHEDFSEDEVAHLQRMEECVAYVSKHLSVKAGKEANTIDISAKAHTARLAHDIVENLMTEFTKQYVSVHQSKGSLKFFEDELHKANERVVREENAIRDLKNKMEMMTVHDKQALIQQELTAIQAEKISSQSALTSVIAEIDNLTLALEKQPEFVNLETTDKPSYASDLMRQNLYQLEMTENELKSKYNDDHPMLVQVREKLQTSRQIFDKAGSRSGESKKSLNQVRPNVEMSLINAIAKRDSLIAKLDGLEISMSDAKMKMRDLNAADTQMSEVQRMVDLARSDYNNYAKKLEEARIRMELDKNVITDLSEVQHATLVLEKDSPRRMLLLAVVAAASLLVGLAFAIWRDQGDYRSAMSETGMPFMVGGLVQEEMKDAEVPKPIVVLRQRNRQDGVVGEIVEAMDEKVRDHVLNDGAKTLS